MMNRLLVVRNRQGRFFVRRVLVDVCALWLSASVAALAQSTAPALKATQPFSIRATHVAGLPNTKSNCKGTLSAQDNVLQFQQSGKTVAQIDIASVRQVFLGEEEMQVGGLPMKIGKAAAPYGGGRLVSLFAHKKYDTLTLEYVDGDGGVHGAIFQIDKGQGELVRNELVARGVSSSSGENQATKQSTSEVTHDDK
jgi:hypothetical protein